MTASRLTSSAGFTLIAAMAAVVIIGIMAGAASQSWRTVMQRDREAELLFRGTQYRDAIARWYKPPRGVTTFTARPLKELKDLLEDPFSAEKVHYLRRLYKDPINGKEFKPILDATQRIVGVRSESEDPPLKKGNFPDDLKALADKGKYSEWEFNYQQATPRTVPPVPPRPPGG